MAAMPVGAGPLGAWLEPFAAALGRQTWRRAVVLVTGGARCCRPAGARSPPRCAPLVAAFAPHGPVVVALDDTPERRWGRRIRARGIYRDPVRSSHGHFVKASGLRWLSLMLVVPIPWARRRPWALPFLTVLAPSERYARAQAREPAQA